ncbi:RDD family protein [Gemmatimonadota bacterium]
MILPKYRTFAQRFGAALIDLLVILPVGLILGLGYELAPTPYVRVPVYLVLSFSYIAYSILLHGHYGQTAGKMLTGVKVLTVSENKIGYRRAFLRDSPWVFTTLIASSMEVPRLVAGIDVLNEATPTIGSFVLSIASTVWFLLELATMLLNEKRRAIHDFIAGTVVVRTKVKPREHESKPREHESKPREHESDWAQLGRVIVILFGLFILLLVVLFVKSRVA